MRYILLILLCCFSISGCKNNKLSSDYLSNISVIRETEEVRNARKTASSVPEEAVVQTPRPSSDTEIYHVIVASFSYAEKAKAERLAAKLKEEGYPAKVLNSAQRYRVSIESFPTEAAANAARDEYRAITDRQDIWVLK